MPEEKTIHDLPIAEQVTSSDVFETEIPSQLMQSGFASRKVSLSELEEHILGDEQYSTGLPNFPAGSRTIFGALEYARQSGGGGGASVIQKTMAEYTALPSSEKMNGSIYKITDKALIYCLDEEYHAVKEITSADYALLTSDEKNNGTLYVITDEETTADDIEYTSGVSVADKLGEIPTLVSGTVSVSSGVTMRNVRLYKYGRVVYFRAEVKVDSPTSWQTIATIPIEYRPSDSVYNVMDKTANMTGTLTAHITVEVNGNVRLANLLPDANSEYRFSLTWIIG